MNYQEFAAKVKAKYPEYADMDDRELTDRVIKKYPEYKSQVTFETQQPAPSDKGALRTAAESFVNSPALPIAGGVVGGVLGAPLGPGAMITAGAGAAAGEGYRQIAARGLGMEAPDTASEAAKGMGVQGALAMAGEGAGQAVMAGARTLAVPAARRALGFASRFLKNKFGRAQATDAAKVALDNDIIPYSGATNTMYERASDLAKTAGSKIGDDLRKIEFKDIAPEAELDLSILRKKMSKGTDEGLLAGANSVIDNVKTTILQLYGRGATAAEYNQMKNILGSSLNYFADASSQGINKKVVNSMANTIRQTVKKYLPDSYEEFLKNQKLFNAAENMKKALNDEIGKQMGNNALSLPAIGVGVGNVIAGEPVKAMAEIGGVETAKRLGLGITARSLNDLSKANRAVRVGSQSAFGSLGLINRKEKNQ